VGSGARTTSVEILVTPLGSGFRQRHGAFGDDPPGAERDDHAAANRCDRSIHGDAGRSERS